MKCCSVGGFCQPRYPRLAPNNYFCLDRIVPVLLAESLRMRKLAYSISAPCNEALFVLRTYSRTLFLLQGCNQARTFFEPSGRVDQSTKQAFCLTASMLAAQRVQLGAPSTAL